MKNELAQVPEQSEFTCSADVFAAGHVEGAMGKWLRSRTPREPLRYLAEAQDVEATVDE